AAACAADVTAERDTLSLHDALPICGQTSGTQNPANKTPKPGQKPAQKPKSSGQGGSANGKATPNKTPAASGGAAASGKKKSGRRSEEHTSELQSRENLVCRLLLEKK